MAPNIREFLVKNLVQISLLVPEILNGSQIFCAPLFQGTMGFMQLQ